MTEQEITYLKVKFPNAHFQSLEDLSISPANSSKALDSTRHEYSAKLEAVNFDKVKEGWYQSRFHDQVKSCDALYYHDNDYFLIEFKTGQVDGLDVFRKIYDSIIGLIEHNILTLDDCRQHLNVILIANNAEESPNQPYADRLLGLAEWTYPTEGDRWKKFWENLKNKDIRRLTNFLVKWAYRMTPDDFERYCMEKL